jgi:DNA-binding LacI/PurR family transcriptional regulator
MNGRVTIKDVAEQAHVSFKTVSNVVNDTGNMRPETRRHVQKVLKEMGYLANVSARSLRTGTNKLIGLGIDTFAQPFAPYFAGQVIAAARDKGYAVVVDTYGDDIESIISDATRIAADGWILHVTAPWENEGETLLQEYPVVAVGEQHSFNKADSVTMPNVQAVKDITTTLLAMGHRKVALIGEPPEWNILHKKGMSDVQLHELALNSSQGAQELRTRGYVEAFDDAGIPINWDMMLPGYSWTRSSGSRAANELLDKGVVPEVVVCLNDALALGAIHSFQLHELNVPQDIQVTGFDNITESEYSNPPLTTIDPSVEEYAQTAVTMLIERIEGYTGPARSTVTQYSFVERQSASLK